MDDGDNQTFLHGPMARKRRLAEDRFVVQANELGFRSAKSIPRRLARFVRRSFSSQTIFIVNMSTRKRPAVNYFVYEKRRSIASPDLRFIDNDTTGAYLSRA